MNYIDYKIVILPQSKPNEVVGTLLKCIQTSGGKEFIGELSLCTYPYNGHRAYEYYQPQHLYFTSDEEIKEGDKVIVDSIVGTVIEMFDSVCEVDLRWSSTQTKTQIDCKKILASTDPKLIADGIPAIPQSFIQKYVKENGKIDVV